jgi:hypothetical protein
MMGPAHGATTGGYPFWLFTVIDLVFVVLTLRSGKFYPILQTPSRPVERRRQPVLYWLIVLLMLAVMAVLVAAAIRFDRGSTIHW